MGVNHHFKGKERKEELLLFLAFGMSRIRASLHLVTEVLGAAAQELGCCKAGQGVAFGVNCPLLLDGP